jgi:LmbE family N-acetylglucosaminyl deacetylase
VTFPPSAEPITDAQRVLCVAAHPDDLDFGCSGTVAAWVDQGIDVTYLIVTRGEAGGFDDDVPRSAIPGIREAEQRAAAEELGVTKVEFLDGYRDGTVMPTLALRKDLTAAIRRHRPDRVVTSSPLRRWERIHGPSHPDHLAVGEAVTCAVYPDARNPFAHDDLRDLPAWEVREIWFFGGPSPDHGIDVSATFDRKLAALRAHVSQTERHVDLRAMLEPMHRANAKASGLPEGSVAEAFTVIRTA